tara:strand:- start:78 stop:512 length:435 start_codon:yes stop_codon:yes gene_type:complete
MGNIKTRLFNKNTNKNNRNYINNNEGLFENLVNDFNADLDYNTNINLFDNKEIKTKNQLDMFQKNIINLVSQLQLKIDKIEKEKRTIENKNNIYKVNEQINLIHKDLESLMTNDKIIIDNINSLTSNNIFINNKLISKDIDITY